MERWGRSGVTQALQLVRDGEVNYLLIENVKALFTQLYVRFLKKVLREIAKLGMEARFCRLHGFNTGAPQTRGRIFILCSRVGWDALEQLVPCARVKFQT